MPTTIPSTLLSSFRIGRCAIAERDLKIRFTSLAASPVISSIRIDSIILVLFFSFTLLYKRIASERTNREMTRDSSILISSTNPFFIPAYPRQRANKITQTSSTFIFSPVYFISIISMLFAVTARNRFPPSVFKSCVCSGIGPLYFSFPFRL